MSTSVLRFIDFDYIPITARNNPDYFIKYYTNSEVSFSLSNNIYLTTRQTDNACTQYCNSTNFTDRLDYEVIRYSIGNVFSDWKIIGSSDLDYTNSNLANQSEKKLRTLISSDSSITINASGNTLDITTSGQSDQIDISETNLINKSLLPPKMKTLYSGDLQIVTNGNNLNLNAPNLLNNLATTASVISNLIAKNNDGNITKNLRILEIDNVTGLTINDPKITIQELPKYLQFNVTNLVSRVSDNKTFSNLQYSTGKLKSLLGDDNIVVTNTDNSTITISSGNCLLNSSSNLIIPDTKYLNNLQVTEITKSASDGKIQLTQENGNLTINVGNCLSRYQQDSNLCNMQSGGYCRSLAFGDNEFNLNLSNGSWMRFINNKLITNNAATSSETVSNLICRDSSSVVSKELKNLVAGNNIILTSSNETLTISATSMSTADFELFKWTTIEISAIPGLLNESNYYGFDIGNNQHIYLKNTINKSTFEIQNDTQNYTTGLPSKTCIMDMTKSDKSCYLFWSGKMHAEFLREGCVYQFIHTPSTNFTKITMLNDNESKNTQNIDTPSSPYIAIRELHNRDTYRYNCFAGQTNTLYLYVYDEFLSLGCSIDIFAQNMNTSNTVLNVVLCNSDGTEFTTDDAKKINYKFLGTNNSRNVGLNPNWSSDHILSFRISSDAAEYLNTLHLDISSGNYIVWY